MRNPLYPTNEAFKAFSGIDLEETFYGPEGAEAFVTRVLTRLEAWVKTISGFDIQKPRRPLNQYQLAELQLAYMEQLCYVLKNGEIQTDSGYDAVNIRSIDKYRLNDIDIARMAVLHLKNGGFLNNSLNRGGFGDILRGLI